MSSNKALDAYNDDHPWCEICGGDPCPDPHHIRTRGAGGDDSPANLIRLCFDHHMEAHRIGSTSFGCKYGLTKRITAALSRPRRKGKA